MTQTPVCGKMYVKCMGDLLKWVMRFTPLGMLFNNGKWLSNKLFKTEFDNTYDDLASLPAFDSKNILSSVMGKYAATNRTGQQIAEDEYTAMREDSRFQREVADMQRAGLNPAMMYGSGASSPSVNSAAQGSSGSLSDLLQLAMLPLQMKTQQAEIANLQSQSNLNDANAAHVLQQKEFEAELQPLLVDARKEANSLTRAERAKINAELDVLANQAKKFAEEAKTESEKQSYYIAETALRNAEAGQVVALMPYREALMKAETDAARAQAAFSAIQAMYQQRLIDGGYLDAMIREMQSQAATSESKQKIQELGTRIRTGSLINVADDASLIAKIGAGVVNYPVAVVANILDMASPVIAATLGAAAAVKVAGLKNAGKPSTSSSLYLPSGTRAFDSSYNVR